MPSSSPSTRQSLCGSLPRSFPRHTLLSSTATVKDVQRKTPLRLHFRGRGSSRGHPKLDGYPRKGPGPRDPISVSSWPSRRVGGSTVVSQVSLRPPRLFHRPPLETSPGPVRQSGLPDGWISSSRGLVDSLPDPTGGRRVTPTVSPSSSCRGTFLRRLDLETRV